ncbi:hypothetical protein V8941_16620, partial [Acinetobacter soli]
GGGRSDPRSARPVDNRGDARPCATLVPVQQRRAHPGSSRPVFQRGPVRSAALRSPLWQGPQGTGLSTLAGNRDVAQEVVGTSPTRVR